MSLAPDECSRRVLKAPNKSESTGNENEGADETCSSDGTTDGRSPGDSSSRSKCQQASQLRVVDKPVDEVPANEVPANVQHRIGEKHRGTHLIQVEVTSPDQGLGCVPELLVQEQIPLGDALTNELNSHMDPNTATSGLSTTATPSGLGFGSNALLMGSSFGNQYDNQGFNTNSTVIDWDMLQGSNGLQEPGNTPPDLWFNSISSLLPQDPQQNANLVFDPSSFIPDPFPNNDAQELYLPNAYSPSDSLLPPEFISIGGINPPPTAPITGTVVPDVTPLLASIPNQECHLHPPSTSVQLAANISLGLLDEKDVGVVADESRRDEQLQSNSRKKRGGARKRKAENAMVGAKDSGAPKPKKKHMGRAAEQESTDVTGTTEADVLEKEAEVAEEAAIEAAKAAKAAAKAAKEAREVAAQEPTRKSGRVSTLPGFLKGGGYTRPKRVSREKKNS